MSDALYERYKDALRRGHVAALRHRYDAALAAYGEAAALAPDRAIPQASLASVLDRLGRREEALAAYDQALQSSSRHEPALVGRADVLVALGRRVEAAEALTRVAEMHEAEGRWVEACDAATRALELAESKDRRRHLEGLSARLRYLRGDEAAATVLARAVPLLEGTRPLVVPGEGAPEPAPLAVSEPAAVPAWLAEPSEAESLGAEPGSAAYESPAEMATANVAQSPVEMAPPAEMSPPAAPAPPAPPADGVALAAVAEALLDDGDLLAAHDRFLAAAAAHRATGRVQAALDVYYDVLAIAPADGDLHLALAELYLERGWRALAVDKLALLGRLSQLDANEVTLERICALAADRLPDEPRLVGMCAQEGVSTSA